MLHFRIKKKIQDWQNSNYESDKIKNFTNKVPFSLYPLVGLMHNETIKKKKKKMAQLLPSKKVIEVSFVTAEMEKLEKNPAYGRH